MGGITSRLWESMLTSSKESQINELAELYKLSRPGGTIKIGTDLDPEVYNDKSRRVINSLEQAAKRGVEIKIMYDTDVEIPQPYKELAEQGKIEIKQVEKIPRYFSVIDEHFIREEQHKPFERKISITHGKAPPIPPYLSFLLLQTLDEKITTGKRPPIRELDYRNIEPYPKIGRYLSKLFDEWYESENT